MTDQYHKMLKTILQILLLKQASEKVKKFQQLNKVMNKHFRVTFIFDSANE